MKRILLSATAALALVASMIAANADPYEGARRAQQEYLRSEAPRRCLIQTTVLVRWIMARQWPT
jgi:hypothetical protein